MKMKPGVIIKNRKQVVIELHIGNMSWIYHLLLLGVRIAAAVQRFKCRILKREASRIFVNCEVEGFVPGGNVLSVEQAAKITAAAVEKGLSSYKRATDPKLLKLVDENTQLSSRNAELLRDCYENKDVVATYRDRDKTDRKDLVQEIAEQHLVLGRAKKANQALKQQVGELQTLLEMSDKKLKKASKNWLSGLTQNN